MALLGGNWIIWNALKPNHSHTFWRRRRAPLRRHRCQFHHYKSISISCSSLSPPPILKNVLCRILFLTCGQPIYEGPRVLDPISGGCSKEIQRQHSLRKDGALRSSFDATTTSHCFCQHLSPSSGRTIASTHTFNCHWQKIRGKKNLKRRNKA